VHAAAVIIKECMEGAVYLGNVDLQVKVHVGKAWGELKLHEINEDIMRKWKEESDCTFRRDRIVGVNNIARSIFGKDEGEKEEGEMKIV